MSAKTSFLHNRLASEVIKILSLRSKSSRFKRMIVSTGVGFHKKNDTALKIDFEVVENHKQKFNFL